MTTSYHLPMDAIRDRTLVNPSGLDAKVSGNPQIVPGVVSNALKIDGRTQKIKVSGPGHRSECFGNLRLCNKGKWVRLFGHHIHSQVIVFTLSKQAFNES